MRDLNLKPILKSKEFLNVFDIAMADEIDFKLLGAGEYNINYIFNHPKSKEKLILRIPTGSQMDLKNQIRYEYEALKLLETSGRTPKPIYIDDTKTFIPYGFLVMNYLPGRSLKYESDMKIAAHILADIHNIEIKENSHLIKPENPLKAILNECNKMVKTYMSYEKASKEIKQIIAELLKEGEKIIAEDHGKRSIINTELNSGNFLINGKNSNNYLIDWEKPLLAYVGQDLGHFLAPTTTFWKTNTILKRNDIDSFISSYCKYSNRYADAEELWNDTLPYFTMTCLRGITWCAMAFVEYQNPNRLLKNEYTYKKIQDYLNLEFLELIKNEYIKV